MSKPTPDELDVLIERQQKFLDVTALSALSGLNATIPFADELETAALEWQTLEALQVLKEFL